ncbi:FliH/SctL family protein [Desulfonispora thiosulfatigenes]|uniref:FliH/SctL family protein n=1 Tax=Desulfonispora thiosulfatigenes TaxID=83661 RepID=UPI001A9A5E42|nr:FliH/SctL family protein [Desulfonispora thiosulfatigenes]
MSSKVIKSVDNSLEGFSIKTKTIAGQNQNNEGNAESEYAILKDAKKQAAFILEKAHEEISALKENSYQEIENLKNEAYEAAYEQGYNEGFAKGQEDAWQKVQEETTGIYDAAKSVLREARQIEKEIYQETEQEIIELCIEMTEKLVSRQIDVNSETIIDIVKEACQQKIEAKQFVIYANPSEVEIIRENKERIASELDSTAKIQIIADNSIEPGGCYLENEEGYVDATLQKRLENLGFAIRSEAV